MRPSSDTNDTITRFVELDTVRATAELRAILARTVREHGRQEDFTPTEVILCLAAMYIVPYNKFGGNNAHTAGSPVPELSALFKRPPTSVLAKMANLASARANGGKGEPAAAAALLEDGGAGLLRCYETVVAAARALGVTESELPDFLPVRPWLAGGLLPSATP